MPTVSYIRFEKTPESSTLLTLVRHLNKPPADIVKFNGNLLEYQRFKRQFQICIIANCDSDDENLSYLEQFTSGEPNKIVKAYSYLNSTKGLKAAINQLDERYGDSDIIAECEYVVQDIESLKVLEYSENFKKVVSKLPFALQEKWRSIVQEKREHGKRPVFHDLVHLV